MCRKTTTWAKHKNTKHSTTDPMRNFRSRNFLKTCGRIEYKIFQWLSIEIWREWDIKCPICFAVVFADFGAIRFLIKYSVIEIFYKKPNWPQKHETYANVKNNHKESRADFQVSELFENHVFTVTPDISMLTLKYYFDK